MRTGILNTSDKIDLKFIDKVESSKVYLVLQFSALPDSNFFKTNNIQPKYYLDEYSIIAMVSKNIDFSKIAGLQWYGNLLGELKISQSAKEKRKLRS